MYPFLGPRGRANAQTCPLMQLRPFFRPRGRADARQCPFTQMCPFLSPRGRANARTCPLSQMCPFPSQLNRATTTPCPPHADVAHASGATAVGPETPAKQPSGACLHARSPAYRHQVHGGPAAMCRHDCTVCQPGSGGLVNGCSPLPCCASSCPGEDAGCARQLSPLPILNCKR